MCGQGVTGASLGCQVFSTRNGRTLTERDFPASKVEEAYAFIAQYVPGISKYLRTLPLIHYT